MIGSVDVIVVYTLLLAASLWSTGVVTVAHQPLPVLFRPLRRARLLGGALAVDVLLVPSTMLLLAWLLPGITDGMRIGLVLIAASSTGPIGSVLTRIARGDQPLAASLITAFGALNLVTVPGIGALLLGKTVGFPLSEVLTSMMLLVFAPLLVGYLWTVISRARKVSESRSAAQMRVMGTVSSVTLAMAMSIALIYDWDRVVELLFSPVGLLSIVTMVVIGVAGFVVGDTRVRKITLAIVLNARGGGLALTVAALHFSAVTDVRATVVTFSLVTQVLPTVLVLALRRFVREQPRDEVTT